MSTFLLVQHRKNACLPDLGESRINLEKFMAEVEKGLESFPFEAFCCQDWRQFLDYFGIGIILTEKRC